MYKPSSMHLHTQIKLQTEVLRIAIKHYKTKADSRHRDALHDAYTGLAKLVGNTPDERMGKMLNEAKGLLGK